MAPKIVIDRLSKLGDMGIQVDYACGRNILLKPDDIKVIIERYGDFLICDPTLQNRLVCKHCGARCIDRKLASNWQVTASGHRSP